jgi:hypothetical protein
MNRFYKLTSILCVGTPYFCFADHKEFDFIDNLQYRSNTPIEDRFQTGRLNSINAFAVSVFDGHGGNLVVTFFLFRQSTLLRICRSA